MAACCVSFVWFKAAICAQVLLCLLLWNSASRQDPIVNQSIETQKPGFEKEIGGLHNPPSHLGHYYNAGIFKQQNHHKRKQKIKKRENQFRFFQYEYAMKKIMHLNIRHLKDLASINANLIICQT